jgi:predicted NUDIX family NTP pyrophosphohydrolase
MRRSAGILLYRLTDASPEVLIDHPGGPLWARKQEGAWSIVKGEVDAGEEPLAAAIREFEEETGRAASSPPTASPSARSGRRPARS